MAPAYDGSISINTNIDQAGINTGTKAMNDAFTKMGGALKNILGQITAIVAGYVSLHYALSLVSQYNLWASSFGSQIFALNWAFQTLQGSIVNMLMTAFVPMIPTIILIINWLARLFQYITLIVGALFGLNQTIGNIARNGALASFDKINTLQDKFGPALSPPPLTIPQDLLDKVDALKKKVAELLAPLMAIWNQFLGPFGNWINTIAIPWLLTQLGKLADWAAVSPAYFDGLIGALVLVGFAIAAIFSPAAALILLFGLIIAMVILLVLGWGQLGNTINELVSIYFWILGKAIGIIATIIYELVSVYIWILLQAFDALGKAMGVLGNIFNVVWTGIRDFVKGIINDIIGFIETMVNSIIVGLDAVISGANSIGSLIPGYKPTSPIPPVNIPRLATGAVIPPNSAFLAILGDQHSGTNIEAPADLIRSIMAEEIARNTPNVNISFNGDLSSLARIMKPKIDFENVRVGNNLIKRTGQVPIS